MYRLIGNFSLHSLCFLATNKSTEKEPANFGTEYRKLLGYVRRRIDAVAARDAEDFVHDVAVNLFDRADVGLPIEHLSAYVYQALQNRIIGLPTTVSVLAAEDLAFREILIQA